MAYKLGKYCVNESMVIWMMAGSVLRILALEYLGSGLP